MNVLYCNETEDLEIYELWNEKWGGGGGGVTLVKCQL